MSPVSLLPILPIILLALITVHLMGKVMPIQIAKGHYAAIDGLRGYLAFLVFLHHSIIWYFFLRFHYWGLPPSHIYSHFGPTSVSLFFMITAFLFFSKLLKAQSGTMDWLKLYMGRFFRILPLYLMAVLGVFLIVGFLSGFRLRVPAIDIILQLLQWVGLMTPDINGINGTWIIVAGVIGSLSFEWLFYYSLALTGFFFLHIKTSYLVLVSTGLMLLFFVMVIYQFYPHLAILRVCWFFGGILSAYLVRIERVRQLAVRRESSVFIFLLLGVAIFFFPTIDEILPYLCVSLAFIGIACGNTLFGILTNTTSRQLGQISYSIFMLHGILLFFTFQFVLGFQQASSLSPIFYWVTIYFISIFLVMICSFTYYYIELPFINAAPGKTAWLEHILNRKTPTSQSHG
jgi:peptidoglycan/LPS O-acetylase OafA/YrhL